MLYFPARHKPKFKNTGIIPGHKLTPDFFLAFNEDGGNTVWDLISKNPYNLDGTYTPGWGEVGIYFNASRTHVNGPLFNSLIPANSDVTILFGYKNFIIPDWNTFLTAGDTYLNFSFYCNSSGIYTTINDGESGSLSYSNYQNHEVLGFTHDNSGGVTTKFYGDGELLGTDTSGRSITDLSLIFNIGGNPGQSLAYAGGIYKWFYVKIGVLSDAEIASLSANPWQWTYDKSEMLIRSVWVISEGLSLLKIINETEQMVEVDQRNLSMNRVQNETLNIVESAIRTFFKLQIINEVMNVVETIQRNLILTRIKNETSNILEASQRNLTLTRVKNEVMNIVETIQRNLTLVRIKNETLSLIETSLRVTGLLKIVNEVITIGETVLKVLTALVVGPVQIIVRLFKKDTEYREFMMDTSTKVFTKKDKDKEFYVD